MIDVFQPLWLQSVYLLINSNSNSITKNSIPLTIFFSLSLDEMLLK